MSAYDIVVMCDGPIRYCELGDLSGTNAKDSSASGQNGTIHGTVLYNDIGLIKGDPSGSMGFVAANSAYISLPTGSNPWTLEGWIRLFSVPTSGYYEVVSFGTGSANQAPQLYVHSSTFFCSIWTNGVSGGSAALNTTYHVVGLWDGTNLALYLNGSQVATTTSYTPNVSLSWANIGADSNNEDFLDGNIQKVAIYAKALRPDQIAAHYRAGLSAQFIQAHRSFIDVRGYN